MSIELEHRFGRDSPVRDYWLAASEGFEVQAPDGRPLGTVKQVVHEQDGRAAALVVESRRSLGRVEEMILEAEAVAEVAPWRSALVVPAPVEPEREPRAGDGRLHRIRAALGAADAAAAAGLAAASRGYAAGARRDAGALYARWPIVRALLLHAWAWIAAVAIGLAAAAVQLVRALVAWVAAARSTARP